MFNWVIWNGQTFNGSLGYAFASNDNISFNGFGLQNATYCIQSTNRDDIAKIDIVNFDRPQLNGGFVLNRYYRDKIITMTGSIKWASEALLITAIDNLKGELDGIEGYLQVKFGNSYRRIKATVSNIDIPRKHYNIDYITFSISFLCKEPFFSDIPSLESTFLGKNASFQDGITYTGTGESSTRTNIVFNSASWVTSVAMTVEGKTVTLSQAINTGDVVVMDGERKSITVNGVETDYLGTFKDLVNWNNIITRTINGTFNIDISVLYKKLYK